MDGATLKALIQQANPQALRLGGAAVQHAARLRPKHRNVVILDELGYKRDEIASAVGYSVNRVAVILTWKDKELEDIRVQVRERVLASTTDVGNKIALASKEMLDILLGHARQTANPPLSRLAAKDILAMAGYTPVKRTINTNINVPVEQLADVFGKIEKANEVAVNADQWTVRKVG